jgi:nucleotide-binding universal stress UspA family protein
MASDLYKKIIIPVDNSCYSNYCTDIAIALAKQFGSELTGSHVYSASLHDKRFRDMEVGLPGHYQEEERLKKSRKIHDSLIGTGLKMISDAYLDGFKKRCQASSVAFTCKIAEGKNWAEVVKEVRDNDYDLVILGILGLGAVNGNLVGSVCERVVRKVAADVLVVKNDKPLAGRVVVAIDGSPDSFVAVKKALALGKRFGLAIEAVSVYDPYFHKRAFQALVGVLSDEAGKMFRFREQEKMHDEIIDDGLGKIYQGHLDEAVRMGQVEGIAVKSTLLAGKAYHEIVKYLDQEPPSLLVVSRFGAHKADEQDIGNTTENLLRLAPCNLLITGAPSRTESL